MGSRNRNLTEQRDDFLLETNFDDDGALTRAHMNNNRVSNASGMAETRPRAYRSNYSIDRYSDAAKSYREGQILSEHCTRAFCDVNQSTNSLEIAKRKILLLPRCVIAYHTHLEIIFIVRIYLMFDRSRPSGWHN